MKPRSGLEVITRGLVVIYRSEGHDVAALSGVDLRVGPGEMLGLLGPSGAGKSTLLTVFGALLAPSAGRVHVGSHDLSSLSGDELDAFRAGEVGLVLQGANRNLMPYLTPGQNIKFAQRQARRLGRDVPSVEDVLDIVGLVSLRDTSLEFLTPSQLQLCALAVGVAAFPGLLLCDEPTSQQGHKSRERVLQGLRQINDKVGSTIVVVTHDPEVAAALPRTVTIRDGRVGAEGRGGEEFSVVTADGSLPLAGAALVHFPPGSLVRLHLEHGTWMLLAPASDDS